MSSYTIIDTHAHLYVDQFDQDRDKMIGRALEEGVNRIYLPNIDMNTIESMQKLADQYPARLFPMMGLHPCSVDSAFQSVLDKMESMLNDRDYSGIGETGIDLYWDKSTRALQVSSFERHIEWAIRYELPLIIHSRSALDVTIEMVESNVHDKLTGIFHCFDGSQEDAERIFAAGFYIGIGGVVTYKKSQIIDVVRAVGLDRVVLETDAPYLSPAPKRGKRNESAYINYTAAYIAEKLGLSKSEVAEITTGNALAIFDS